MTAIESTYVDTQDFTAVTGAMLIATEPSINWPVAGATKLATAACAATPGAANTDASKSQVMVGATGAAKYEIGTVSKSGTAFGVAVDKTTGNTYYKAGSATASGAAW